MAKVVEHGTTVVELSMDEIRILKDALGRLPVDKPDTELYDFFLNLSGEES